jgi:hypothetical protein
MGYSFIPLFLGNIFAGLISGDVYQQMSDKHTLLKREVAERGITLSDDLTQNQYFDQAAASMGMSPAELTNYLWQTYHPSTIWMVIFGIGIFAALSLWLYNKFLIGKGNNLSVG